MRCPGRSVQPSICTATAVCRSRLGLAAHLILGLAVSGWLALGGLSAPPACAQDTPPFPLSPPTYDPHSYVQQQWTVEEGLPVNSVKAVKQGPRGYLWLATYDGLVRFDGTEFTTFRSAAYPALPGNRFLELEMGAGGMVWSYLESGELVRLDPTREQFQVYSEDAGTLPGPVAGLERGPQNRVWVFLNGGLLVPSRDTLRSVALPGPPSPVRTVAFAPGDAGRSSPRAWIGTAQGVYRLENGSARRVPRANANAAGGDELRVLDLHLGPDGRLRIAAEEGAFTVHDGTIHPLRLGAAGEAWTRPTAYVHRDTLGRTWLGAEGGPLFVHTGTDLRSFGPESFQRGSGVVAGPGGRRGVVAGGTVYFGGRPVLSAGGPIRDVFVDREENVWLATARDGLYRLRRSPFRTVGAPEGLPSNNVYPILESRSNPGTVWVGTLGGGLARVRTRTDGSSSDPPVRVFGAEAGVPSIVWALHEDRQGRLWVGGQQNLCVVEGGRCRTQIVPDSLAHRREVRAIFQDREGRVWVGTRTHGLYRYDGRTWTDVDPLIPARVITQTDDGALWMGTDGHGLFRYRNGSFDRITTADGLSSNLIRAIYEGENGMLWIGTEDRGLTRIDRNGTPSLADDSMAVVRKRDGLFDNVIHWMLPDERGRLWMSTNRGLFRVNEDSLNAVADGRMAEVRSVSYTEQDGLRSREANGGMQPAGLRDSAGRLWFATQSGAVVVDPSDLYTSRRAVPVVVERVVTDTAAYDAARPVAVGADQRSFEVEFAGLSFADPEALQFRYRLRGLDGGWRDVTGRRQATYTSVPPGRYTFEIAARTEEGPWTQEPATLTITVAPHWWETTWFFAACGLAVVGLAVAGYRWRVHRLQQRQDALETAVADRTEEVRRKNEQLAAQTETLKELDEAKSRFFANVSHEFRTPLTLIRGPVREVRRQLQQGAAELQPEAAAEQLAVAERNTQRLQRLIDQILGLAKMDAGRYELDARPVDFAAEVRRITRSFHPLADRKDLSLSVEGGGTERDGTEADESEGGPVAVVDREALEHVMSNLLSNAIKFTPEGGRVEVRVRETDGGPAVAVRDTGVGIPEEEQDRIFERFAHSQSGSSTREQEGAGIGLAFARDLVDLHGGSLRVESAEGEGTTVTARFPAPDDDPSPDALSPSPDESPLSSSAHDPASPSSPDAPPPVSPDSDAGSDGLGGDGASRRVLVVDDNADVRRYLRQVLTPAYEILTAADGREGVRVAREALPDVILADVMMPEMNGMDMTRRLKSDPETAAIPVIMVTARSATEDEVAGLREGADDFVTKPFDADVLRQRIGGVLRLQERLRRRLREELQDGRAESTGSPSSRSSAGDDAAPDRRNSFARRAQAAIEQHLSDPSFDVSALADALGVSRSTLYRRFDDAFDATPAEVLTRVRVESAADLLREGRGTVTQVAYAVGFERLSNFSDQFTAHHAVRPSEVMDEAS